MITDPIADMLTIIRNAQLVQHSKVEVPASKFKQSILAVMKKNDYISDFHVKKNKIIVDLKYTNGKASMKEIKKISKPGLRVYLPSKRIPRVMQGFGTIIVSTPQGVMTGKEAKSKNVGGEAICQIY